MNMPETQVIDMARKLTRSLVSELTLRGVEPADATVALAYALHDAASDLTGSHISGLDWMREAVRQMDRQLTEASDGKPTTH